MSRLAEVVAEQPIPPILIAHSLGCSTVAILSDKTPVKVAGAFLVAPPDLGRADMPTEIQGFNPTPMKALRFPSMLVASSDDPYSSIEQARALAETWQSAFVNVGPHGHNSLKLTQKITNGRGII